MGGLPAGMCEQHGVFWKVLLEARRVVYRRLWVVMWLLGARFREVFFIQRASFLPYLLLLIFVMEFLCVALAVLLELILWSSLALTCICLSVPLQCWDQRCTPPPLGTCLVFVCFFFKRYIYVLIFIRVCIWIYVCHSLGTEARVRLSAVLVSSFYLLHCLPAHSPQHFN